MVAALKGVLLSCDVPIKQYLLSINEQLPNSEKFVIYDLDDTHLLVQPNATDMLNEKLQKFHDQNTFVAPQA